MLKTWGLVENARVSMSSKSVTYFRFSATSQKGTRSVWAVVTADYERGVR